MRAIILIQAIIIVVGAYYIYTLSHATQVTESPVPVVEMVPTTTTPTVIRTGYTAPTTQPPVDTPTTNPTPSTVTGPNDAGMEYPTNP